jgi:hypothetical protein
MVRARRAYHALCSAAAHRRRGVSGFQPDSARNETSATLQDASEKILRMDIFVQTKFNSP